MTTTHSRRDLPFGGGQRYLKLAAAVAGTFGIYVTMCTGSLRADGDDKTIPLKLTVGGQSVDMTGVVDGGSTASKDNLPGHDFPAPATTLDRTTAQKLGLLDGNGDPKPDMFEKNTNGDVLGVKVTEAGGTESVSAVSKPITIEATDDKGHKTTITLRVVVPTDPADKSTTLLGKDFLKSVDATQVYKTDKFTFGNTEPSVPGAKEKSSLDRSPIPGGMLRKSWDGVIYASAKGSMTGDAFLDFASPDTFLSETTAQLLDLSAIDRIDLSGNTALLDELERSGFYSASATNFGIFSEAVLPTLEVTMDDGSLVVFSNVPVLINPVGTENLLGFRLFREGSGTVDGIPLAEITDIASVDQTFFSPVPEPASGLLLAVGVMFLLAITKRNGSQRRGNR